MTSFLLSLISFVAFFINPVSSLGTTKYEVGPGTRMRDYAYLATCTGSGANPACAHKPSTNMWIGDIPFLADITGTGSATVTTTGPTGVAGTKYAGACVPNPYRKMGTGTGKTFFNTGTGTVTALIYKNVRNPAAASGDIGFVHDCASGTGDTLLANLPTTTGAVIRFVPTATNGAFNGYDFIKVGFSSDPTSSYRGELYYRVLGL